MDNRQTWIITTIGDLHNDSASSFEVDGSGLIPLSPTKCNYIMCFLNPKTIHILKGKASNSPCTYRISAIAFDHKGDILGVFSNSHSRNWNVLEKYKEGRAGTGQHCERLAISKFGRRIKNIIIMRVGRSGDILPIDPCPICKKVADKYGITISTVHPETIKLRKCK